jgi:hypothetical protein
MASDAEWVEDVKRWYQAGRHTAEGGKPSADAAAALADDGEALGYEAAHPALQAQNWPDAPVPSGTST